jgi:hypothetical protein
MKATTRGFVILLTCVACASTVAAQTAEDTRTRQRERKVEIAQDQVRAKAEAAQRRSGGARIGGARGGGQAEATETLTRTVRLEPGGTFELQNMAGDVTITGGSGREATIEATKKVRAVSGARAQVLLPQVRVEIAERGGNVEVHTFRPNGANQVTVDYVITLPENANVILRTTSGNLRVQRMSGDELTANTLSGSVTLSELKSRILELRTVMGDMNLRDVEAQRAFLQSTLGNLEYAGRFQRTGRYQLTTHGGNIRVITPGTPGFDLDAMTYRGDLRSDFPFRVIQQPRPAARGPRAQKILRGAVGDAGAMLTMSSFSGNIVIVKPEGQ